jgi:predicted phosphodiesterase
MRLAIFSDIHGNFDAFERVLDDIAGQHIDHLLCNGDCIGYGPEPEQVVAEIRRREIPTVMGNHENAAIDQKAMDWFNPLAQVSLKATVTMLTPESLEFIGRMPTSLVTAGCRCVHGYPPDCFKTYLFRKSFNALKKTLEEMEESVCFVGHTHDLEIICYDGRTVDRSPLEQGTVELDPEYKYIVNIGSVGQPRDGNNNAKYVIWEPEHHRLEVRYVPYDIAAVVAKIEAAGLPEQHGRRLW